jgi:hypothetical protein
MKVETTIPFSEALKNPETRIETIAILGDELKATTDPVRQRVIKEMLSEAGAACKSRP